jgi:succinyl-CoA synthetase alpha subunit
MIDNNQEIRSPKDRIKLIYEPQSVVLIGSSVITEEVGMTSPELFSNIAYNMDKYFNFNFTVIDIEKNDNVPKVDLAIIVLPPENSVAWAERAMDAGVSAIIQITGGFNSETRKRYLDLAMKHHVRLLGPNTI